MAYLQEASNKKSNQCMPVLLNHIFFLVVVVFVVAVVHCDGGKKEKKNADPLVGFSVFPSNFFFLEGGKQNHRQKQTHEYTQL